MQQRKLAGATGRPSGTDGSDFSFRMVVDSRYTRVAKAKSRLHVLIVTQAVIQVVGALRLVISLAKKENPDRLAAASTTIGFLSILIGELGCRRSRVNLLKSFMFTSTTAILPAIACLGRSKIWVEVIEEPNMWDKNKFQLLEIASVLAGSLVQIFTLLTTMSLIRNMSPPKRAS